RQMLAEPVADRMRHRDMRDAALAEEALLPREGAIDELIGEDESAGRQIDIEAADRRERDEIGDARAFQRVDIGAKIDLRGRQLMAASVPRQEHHLGAAELAEAQLVRRLAEGRPDMPPLD